MFLSMDHRDGELLESLDRTVNLGNLLILSAPVFRDSVIHHILISGDL